MQLFRVRDNKSETYGPLITQTNPATATRVIIDALGEDNPWSKHPEDYALYSVGNESDRTGIIEGHPPVHITDFNQLVADAPATGE